MPQIRVYDAAGNVIETHEQPITGVVVSRQLLLIVQNSLRCRVCSVPAVLPLRECASVKFYMISQSVPRPIAV
jgi:hypothetical protein